MVGFVFDCQLYFVFIFETRHSIVTNHISLDIVNGICGYFRGNAAIPI